MKQLRVFGCSRIQEFRTASRELLEVCVEVHFSEGDRADGDVSRGDGLGHTRIMHQDKWQCPHSKRTSVLKVLRTWLLEKRKPNKK